MKQEIAVDPKAMATVKDMMEELETVLIFAADGAANKNRIELLKLENEMFSNGSNPPHTEAWERAFKETWEHVFETKWRRS